jgi:ACR3 family arsenite efflux pump ArsB
MRRISPFIRNLGILALLAVVIVVFKAQTALATANVLLSVVFAIVIAVVIYFFWRDFGRHELATWPDRQRRVFYAASALLIVDIGWWLWSSPSGRNALAAIVVAAICAYVGFRTWRGQRSYS